MNDELRDYLAAVSAEFGVGLESCSWGSESPRWGYVALERQLGGHDLALLWNEQDGWSAATETSGSLELVIVGRLADEVSPEPTAVASFVARLPVRAPAELLAKGLAMDVRVPATQSPARQAI
ncbi:MAG: DUF6292 family protein [Kibdelosporangium sp.]